MSDISDLLGRIEQETKCIQWAITELKGQAQRIFIDRRMKNLKNNYARLSSTEQETEILATVKLSPHNVQSQPQKAKAELQSKAEMARMREQAKMHYATWLFAATKLTVSQAQTRITTDCFEKLQAYHQQLKEIAGEEQAFTLLAEIMGEVHAATAEAEQEKPAMGEIIEQLV